MSIVRKTFIERVDRLEKRYAKAEYKYVDMYMMPRELMKALRDELKPKPRKKSLNEQKTLF